MESNVEINIWQYLDSIDRELTLAINSFHCEFSDFVWHWFSNREIWYLLYGAVLAMLFYRLGWKKTIVVTVSIILTIVACDQFSNFIKDLVCRLRPCVDEQMLQKGIRVLEGGGGYGFYSAHAANAMGFAISSAAGFRNDRKHKHVIYAVSITAWALLVGISRVFVGRHFFGDVTVGLIIGALFGWAFSVLASKVIRKLKL